ncbi:MAG: nucleoside monophosphate kinase [Candidatus Syntrophosphaera sp.]|nr:nucleoside monophosphate kinase [Candidatus Syntrophosphaera sp.]
MQCYVFFGIQGSGKGTQALLLSESLNFQHVNIGDLLREQVLHQTELGLKAQDIISRGELVPDELVFEIIARSLLPDRQGIVFDGFPRTLRQAEYLVEHFQVLMAFFLELDEAAAIERISSRRICPSCGANFNLISNKPRQDGICDECGGALSIRNDDRPEAISKRLREFYEQTLVLKEFFGQQGLLALIDAGRDIAAVAVSIKDIVDSL